MSRHESLVAQKSSNFGDSCQDCFLENLGLSATCTEDVEDIQWGLIKGTSPLPLGGCRRPGCSELEQNQ